MKKLISFILMLTIVAGTMSFGMITASAATTRSTEVANLAANATLVGADDSDVLTDGSFTTTADLSEAVIDLGALKTFNKITLTAKAAAGTYTISCASAVDGDFATVATGSFNSATEKTYLEAIDKTSARVIKIEASSAVTLCEVGVFFAYDNNEINFANSAIFKDVWGKSQGSDSTKVEKLLAHTMGTTLNDRFNLGSLSAGSGNLAANTWMFVDLGASTDINCLEIARADMGLKTYTLYATNDASVKTTAESLGMNQNGAYNTNPYPAENLSSEWIAASGTLAEGDSNIAINVNTSYANRNLVDVIDFNSTVNARYLLLLVTDAYNPYAAHSRLWSFEVYNKQEETNVGFDKPFANYSDRSIAGNSNVLAPSRGGYAAVRNVMNSTVTDASFELYADDNTTVRRLFWITVDFTKERTFDTIRIYGDKEMLKKASLYSLTAERFAELTNGTTELPEGFLTKEGVTLVQSTTMEPKGSSVTINAADVPKDKMVPTFTMDLTTPLTSRYILFLADEGMGDGYLFTTVRNMEIGMRWTKTGDYEYTIPADTQQIKLDATLCNFGDVNKTSAVVVAQYNSAGALIGASLVDREIASGDNVDIDNKINLLTATKKVKVMTWNLGNLKPEFEQYTLNR